MYYFDLFLNLYDQIAEDVERFNIKTATHDIQFTLLFCALKFNLLLSIRSLLAANDELQTIDILPILLVLIA